MYQYVKAFILPASQLRQIIPELSLHVNQLQVDGFFPGLVQLESKEDGLLVLFGDLAVLALEVLIRAVVFSFDLHFDLQLAPGEVLFEVANDNILEVIVEFAFVNPNA